MESTESNVAKEIRYQQWAELIKECQARPDGMTVREWCNDRNLDINTYYWRMKALRKAILKKQSPPETYKQSEERFIQLPVSCNYEEEKTDPVSAGNITIHTGRTKIEIPSDIPEHVIKSVLGAVLHVK